MTLTNRTETVLLFSLYKSAGMRLLQGILFGLMVCAAITVAQGDDGLPQEGLSEAELVQTVRYLVRQLDGDTLADRNEAEQRLLEFGPRILSHLPEDTAQTPAEVKVRLGRIRTALEQQRADQATQPTTVTLDLTDAPLSEVIEEIHRQTGNELLDFRRNFRQDDTDIEVTVQWEDVPFWQAVDELLDQANLRAYHRTGQGNTLAFVSRVGLEGDRAAEPGYSGIFRFQPIRVDSFRDLETGQAGTRLNLQVTWEPRVTVISLTLPLDSIEIVDDRGEAIELTRQTGAEMSEIQSGMTAATLTLNLPGIDRESVKLAKLAGRIEALIPGGIEVFTFDDPTAARNVRQSKGDVEVILQSFTQIDSLYDARILVRLAGEQGALQSHRGWIYNNPVYLLGPDGERIRRVGFEDYERTVEAIGIAHKFVLEDDADEYQLVYETPASIVTLPLEFEIADVPLP